MWTLSSIPARSVVYGVHNRRPIDKSAARPTSLRRTGRTRLLPHRRRDVPENSTDTIKTHEVETRMPIQPYLFFDGRCEEAIDFYRRTLGAETEMLMRFKDNPEPSNSDMCPPGAADKVMHASLKIGDASVMLSDGRCSGKPIF